MKKNLQTDKETVRSYWNRNVNQLNQLKTAEVGSRAFFEESESLRYRYHYHLPLVFDQIAEKYPGGKLLEIGCSMGTDLLQMARRKFHVTGIDLTTTGIDLAKKRFEMYGFDAELHEGDAENLVFEDETFDVFYSFGVLHHTPNIEQSIREVWRVMKKGGAAGIMLYHRHSLNYSVYKLLGFPFNGTRPDPVPIAYTYSRSQAHKLFGKFSYVLIEVDYLFGRGWGLINRFGPVLLHFILGRCIGWHLKIKVVK